MERVSGLKAELESEHVRGHQKHSHNTSSPRPRTRYYSHTHSAHCHRVIRSKFWMHNSKRMNNTIFLSNIAHFIDYMFRFSVFDISDMPLSNFKCLLDRCYAIDADGF